MEINDITWYDFQDGDIAQHRAARRGYMDLMRFLVDDGADLDARNASGATPMFLASQAGHVQLVRYLAEGRVDLHVGLDFANEGVTPVWIASQNGHVEVVRCLAEHRANLETAPVESDGWTPLCTASHHGHVEVVRCLAEQRANLAPAYSGAMVALVLASRGGHIEVVRCLAERRAELDATMLEGGSALVHASFYGHFQVVRYLIEQEADLNNARATITEPTPLFLACFNRHAEVVRLLASFGAHRHVPSGHLGRSLAAVAEDAGMAEVAAFLRTTRTWDGLCFAGVLEDLLGRDAALAEVRRRLRDGGPVARAVEVVREISGSAVAPLVLQGAEPWSPATHALFPARARARAVRLWLLAHRLPGLPRGLVVQVVGLLVGRTP